MQKSSVVKINNVFMNILKSELMQKMNDKISKIQIKAGSHVEPGCLPFNKAQAVFLVPSVVPSCVSQPSWDHSPAGSCPLPPQPRGVTRKEAEPHPGDCTRAEGRQGLEIS